MVSRKPRTAADLIRESEEAPSLRELHRLRTSLNTERSNVKALQKELDRADLRLDVAAALGNAKPPRPIRKKRGAGKRRQATAVLMASDWHVEERVDPRTVNGENEYTPAIATQRAERLAMAATWRVEAERSAFDIRNGVLWLGGDLITGYIHEELQEGNFLSPVEAVLFAQQLAIRLIDRLLLLDFERLDILCDHGNHGRTTVKTRVGTSAQNSYEWLLYQQIAMHYADTPTVTVHVNAGRVGYHEIYSTTLRHTHGDTIRSAGGVGGIFPSLFKQIARWDTHTRADVTILGHFHTYQSLPQVVTNGSLIGPSAYAQAFAYEQPQQAFFLIDAERGHKADYGLEVGR